MTNAKKGSKAGSDNLWCGLIVLENVHLLNKVADPRCRRAARHTNMKAGYLIALLQVQSRDISLCYCYCALYQTAAVTNLFNFG